MKRAGWVLVVLLDLRAMYGIPVNPMNVRVREAQTSGWNFIFTCPFEAPCTFLLDRPGLVFSVEGDTRTPVLEVVR